MYSIEQICEVFAQVDPAGFTQMGFPAEEYDIEAKAFLLHLQKYPEADPGEVFVEICQEWLSIDATDLKSEFGALFPISEQTVS